MSLQELLTMISQVLPGLDGKIAGQHAQHDYISITIDREPASAVQHLYHYLQTNYPEAGPHYWSCRCWNLLIWQPVYLCVLSTHLAHCVPSLSGMAQTVLPGYVAGFSLPQHTPYKAQTSSLIDTAAQRIATLRASLYEAFRKHIKLPIKLAQMMEADCVASALLHAQRYCGTIRNEDIHTWSQHWLHALRLPDTSAVMEVKTEEEEVGLIVRRKSCCQHFRRADGSMCNDCPKRSLEERQQIFRLHYLSACQQTNEQG